MSLPATVTSMQVGLLSQCKGRTLLTQQSKPEDEEASEKPRGIKAKEIQYLVINVVAFKGISDIVVVFVDVAFSGLVFEEQEPVETR